ncbi:nuclease-related domain-containing protein [Ornithinimicrobium cerasi]|uniref:Nuclease-related domain-containing protein n=1 Tax=Ornithinimicrobium cerasi TaxID=2248773 RepID=A0A285VDZ7_9MICO|nr:nuclease-related domain-containing protein [Ornithinimicrobium cerasi]SOC52290.1 Nuclease-related domain-containing protein [Ornithinimicrobium cerasi]
MDSESTGVSRRAGTGASEQADRSADRARQLREQLGRLERQEKAWRAGSEGERLVADALGRAGWPVLHDQPWPGRDRANIDHLAFSPDRIWLIDAKHWSGEVGIRDGVLRQNGYSRSMAVTKAQVAANDVVLALGTGAPPVHPVLCLTGSGTDLAPTTVEDVVLVGLEHLTECLGPTPTLDVELALLMAKVPEHLKGTAGPTARVAPSKERKAPEAAAAALRRRKHHAGAGGQTSPQRRAASRRGMGRPPRPSAARALISVALLALLVWFAFNLDAVFMLILPVAQWFVGQLMP